ncbi:LodA/GoxA family CTQ-dependent oxidase [Bradyrhizobium barranii subsp. barranii]|uniref:LodA/GoxA family CTQ-dependent oxidase n=1 Tax=Bradyrhizobium barranii subsp. barranii TaxID=2823807 RepID=A0A7Z0QKT8_9BRAD|nr:LodA/GoxA family CTQ-dependent oxidase [Bradyrhizobium barranii]UGX97935.1 LodA/GoxA family CTQ-dependent oxidase [Bradyrhizobium barranii subsp. barranii]
MATYRIHPGIGIARLGNSDSEFYLAPETPAAMPLACDSFGNPLHGPDGVTPVPVKTFKDAQGRVKRQAARFQIFVYDDESPEGRPLALGDAVEGGGNHGVLVDIQWRVYVANKKASWYPFTELKGEHGYAPGSARRNADITGQDRDLLIIDPGPRSVNATTNRRAHFDRSGGTGGYATTFPPRGLQPFDIDTLGEMMTDNKGRLVVLGGHGNSGMDVNGSFGPKIEDYANTDGWYDDISDGPVMARLIMYSKQVGQTRYIDVEFPAWVVVGYPRFVPEILDMITMDEVLYDLYVRQFATDTGIYGTLGTYDDPQQIPFRDEAALRHWQAGRLAWNRNYRPWFYRDIWPILFRPDEFRYLNDILQQSNYPHDQAQRGTFDPDKLSKTPKRATRPTATATPSDAPLRDASQGEAVMAVAAVAGPTHYSKADDPYGPMRRFLFDLLRRAGEANSFQVQDRASSRVHSLPLMPLLCGDNPLTNETPSKFLHLTEYQLFILGQWARGWFINEKEEGWLPDGYSPFAPYPKTPPKTGRELDRGVLSNVLGGAFCPGAELGWVMRNPSIYWAPYRINADRSVSDFLQSAAQANQDHGTVIADPTFNVNSPLSQDNDFETGLQPGDLTKYMGLPWQSDFNECTTQPINITYADWNNLWPGSDNDDRLRRDEKTWTTLWWPAHRPLQSFEIASVSNGKPNYVWTTWSRGVPQTPVGDLKMVTEWSLLGFIVRNPYEPAVKPADSYQGPKYISVERTTGSRPDPKSEAS